MSNADRLHAIDALKAEQLAADAEGRQPSPAILAACYAVLRLNPARREYWHYREPKED